MLYRAYDIEGNLLYVGVTVNFNQRISVHRGKSEWFPMCSKISVKVFKCWTKAVIEERTAVAKEFPLFNVQSLSVEHMICYCCDCIDHAHGNPSYELYDIQRRTNWSAIRHCPRE